MDERDAGVPCATTILSHALDDRVVSAGVAAMTNADAISTRCAACSRRSITVLNFASTRYLADEGPGTDEECFRNRSAQGMKYFQFGPSV